MVDVLLTGQACDIFHILTVLYVFYRQLGLGNWIIAQV